MTNPLRDVRKTLHMTQGDLAEQLNISRGLWSVHEGKPAGHDVPPHIARTLIAFARQRGLPLTYEHLYDSKPLPAMRLLPARLVPVDQPPKRPKPAKRAEATVLEPEPTPSLRTRRRISASAVA